MSRLRRRFDMVLGTEGICPENSLYFVASGAALCAENTIDFNKVIEAVSHYSGSGNFAFNKPLLKTKRNTSISPAATAAHRLIWVSLRATRAEPI